MATVAKHKTSGNRQHAARCSLFTLGVLLLLPVAGLGVQADVPVEQIELPGLSAPVDVRIDHYGVAHIAAQDHYDAFFAQGFNAARDRLWQIDLWRRRGLGQLSEVFGAPFVEQDAAARLLLYRGSMFREWLAYGSDAKRIAEAFAAGVNSYIELAKARPALMPPEFVLLGYAPARWEAADIVRIRSHGLWRNVSSEVRRARVACEHGLVTRYAAQSAGTNLGNTSS